VFCSRVEVDSDAKQKGGSVVASSDFARHYEELLERDDINACRVSIEKPDDIAKLRFQKKLAWVPLSCSTQ